MVSLGPNPVLERQLLVCTVRFLIQELYIRKKCFTQIYRQLKRNAMLVPFSRKICHCVLPRKRKINLEFRRIKRNNSFSARTV